ncbi:MAG TPA: hypothetical protein PLE82_06010 [Saccharofermentans sp.]|nr:hypothetical protein [Saccharofermentans sp.]
MSDYSDVFGQEPEPWREPLGALLLTLADTHTPVLKTLERARHEVRALQKLLNEQYAHAMPTTTGGIVIHDPDLEAALQPTESYHYAIVLQQENMEEFEPLRICGWWPSEAALRNLMSHKYPKSVITTFEQIDKCW